MAVLIKHLVEPFRIVGEDDFWSQYIYEWGKNTLGLATTVGVVYVALYGRFQQQWHYLAGVYNQIMTAEARTGDGVSPHGSKVIIDKWKAAFIEDAATVHLATKRAFAYPIWRWGNDPYVANAYEKLNPEGRNELKKLLDKLSKIYRWSTPQL